VGIASEGLTAGESGFFIVPVTDFVLIHLPAVEDFPVAEAGGEVHQPLLNVPENHAHLLDSRDMFQKMMKVLKEGDANFPASIAPGILEENPKLRALHTLPQSLDFRNSLSEVWQESAGFL